MDKHTALCGNVRIENYDDVFVNNFALNQMILRHHEQKGTLFHIHTCVFV